MNDNMIQKGHQVAATLAPKVAQKQPAKRAPRKKITLSKVLERKVEQLARKRDLNFSELVARVLEEELRRLGIDPYGAKGLDETSRGTRLR